MPSAILICSLEPTRRFQARHCQGDSLAASVTLGSCPRCRLSVLAGLSLSDSVALCERPVVRQNSLAAPPSSHPSTASHGMEINPITNPVFVPSYATLKALCARNGARTNSHSDASELFHSYRPNVVLSVRLIRRDLGWGDRWGLPQVEVLLRQETGLEVDPVPEKKHPTISGDACCSRDRGPLTWIIHHSAELLRRQIDFRARIGNRYKAAIGFKFLGDEAELLCNRISPNSPINRAGA